MAVVALSALSVAAAAPAGAASKPRAEVKLAGASQKGLLKKGLKVKVSTEGEGKVEVKAKSKTFDKPRFKKLTKTERIEFESAGTEKLFLELTKRARRAVEGCEARTIKAKVKGDKDTAELKRNTKSCKPRPIDLSRADTCNFIAPDQLCMLPFPDDFHTVKDKSTQTGRRVDFTDAAMPANEAGVSMAAQPYNLNDGFSPGQPIIARIPGLDTPEAFAATNPIPLNDLSRNDEAKKNEPIVVIDAKTGERHPIWVELDSNAPSAERRALLIHPAVNFESGRRYIVAMRRLKGAPPQSETLEAPEGFRYYRDDLPSKEDAINSQRKRFEKIFKGLRKAEIKRNNLYLAWDFTVASDENITERMLHMRNDAFAQLGDTNLSDLTVQGDAPSFAVGSVQNFTSAEDPEMARRVQGTFEVPCYLSNPDPGPECAPGGRFELNAEGLPTRTDTWSANFDCMIPQAAVDAPGAAPARPQLYGHGLLGRASEATSSPQQLLGNTHNFVVCATEEIGFANSDIANIAGNILPELGQFPELTDRVQQGLLNELFLGRLMIHPDGFLSDAAFHVDPGNPSSAPVIDNSRLYYNGNSQGGILGGALTAIAPDFTRASLGVPGMNYSVLLNRSVDFDTYKLILDPAYPDPAEQQLGLSLVQMLWDRSEANGYAHRMTDDPLPGTPAHEVLMNVAFGDHQVTTWQADVEARTIGASIHTPIVYDGRWPGVDVGWGIPPITSYPFSDSAIVYWDSGPVRDNPAPPPAVIGTDPPPVGNVSNRSGRDPHGDPRVAPAEMQMVSDFLRPDAQSQITDTCNGSPCFSGTFTGP